MVIEVLNRHGQAMLAAAGTVLVLVILTYVTTISAASVAIFAGSVLFGAVLKTVLATGSLIYVLTGMMR